MIIIIPLNPRHFVSSASPPPRRSTSAWPNTKCQASKRKADRGLSTCLSWRKSSFIGKENNHIYISYNIYIYIYIIHIYISSYIIWMNYKTFQQAEMLGDSALLSIIRWTTQSKTIQSICTTDAPQTALHLKLNWSFFGDFWPRKFKLKRTKSGSLSSKYIWERYLFNLRRSWNVTNWNDKLLLKTGGWPFPKTGDGKPPQFLTIT